MKINSAIATSVFKPVTIVIECDTPSELAALLCHANVSVSNVMDSYPGTITLPAEEVDQAIRKLAGPLWEAVSTVAREAGVYTPS